MHDTLMDNRHLDFTSRVDVNMERDIGFAIQMILSDRKPEDITHFLVRSSAITGLTAEYLTTKNNRVVDSLVLLAKEKETAVPFGHKQTVEDITRFCCRWIQEAKYSGRPDIDGDCEPGYRIFSDDWGFTFGSSEAFTIQPIWAMLGK